MALSVSNTPIGIVFPLTRGSVGYFDQSFDTFTAYRMNIINLLRTKPGERRMNPTFGSRLWNIVFEPNDDFIPEKVNKVVKEDVGRWIPGVSVSSVQVKYFQDDQSTDLRDVYKLYIVIQYIVSVINQEDSVELILNTGKI
jgi:phage baseplate assembly protein W